MLQGKIFQGKLGKQGPSLKRGGIFTKLVKVKKISQWLKIRSLYKSAFPRYERKPFSLIIGLHKKGSADVWVIETEDGFSGFAITMNSRDLVLLDYFAVSEKKRGCGIGSEALKKLQKLYSGRRLFLEIESIYAEAENIPERKRRKQFYLSNGMTEMRVMADVFGTHMELLGYDCSVSFKDYLSVYTDNIGKWAAERLKKVPYPNL